MTKQYTEEEIKSHIRYQETFNPKTARMLNQLLESNKIFQQTLDTIMDKFPCNKTIN